MIESADNDKSLCNMVLSIGEEATCYITFEIHPKFSGFLKRLLILTFDVTEEIDLLVRRSTSVTMGVMILGNITPRGLDKGLKMGPLSSKITALPTLSIDAKAFAPISDITMFDTPVSAKSFLFH